MFDVLWLMSPGADAASLSNLAQGHVGGPGLTSGPEHLAASDRWLRRPLLHAGSHHCSRLQLRYKLCFISILCWRDEREDVAVVLSLSASSLCSSTDVEHQRLQPVGVPADHEAGHRLGEGDGLGDRGRPAGHDLPHGALLQHLRTTQWTF